jgi:hypothetical protein
MVDQPRGDQATYAAHTIIVLHRCQCTAARAKEAGPFGRPPPPQLRAMILEYEANHQTKLARRLVDSWQTVPAGECHWRLYAGEGSLTI